MDRIKMGNFLAELRKEKDLSQTDLAEIIGVTFQA
ncbi:MAG: helix-turn-helix domain-containing protein, partial [Anaeroplasmataceae bacterium]|nr:helix-turn-helix domain-containing protein [Anaeroplasmataceae bacterium]